MSARIQSVPEQEVAADEGDRDSFDVTGEKKVRRGLDLATTLERIQKNFVITDPRLPENPIVSHDLSFCRVVFSPVEYNKPYNCQLVQIFASDDFLELTEYSREEVIGRNCRHALITLSLFIPTGAHLLSLSSLHP